MRKQLLLLCMFFAVSAFSQNTDIELLRNINLNRNTQLDGFLKHVSNSAGPVAFGLPVVLFGLSFINKDTLTKQRSFYIGASVVTAVVVTNILKYSINRTRPFNTYDFIEKMSSGGSPSFPSGHTSDAFSLATAVSLVYPKWYVIVPAYAWAATVGYSRMALGVHYPSDVLVGAIIGSGSAFLCYKGQQWLYKKRSHKLANR
ncbi:MAG: phosphatase PAP2 family protein [Bacteroidales bacterium]|nr:phosphatase PAP2 family protein [Bacteroidales bacterium]